MESFLFGRVELHAGDCLEVVKTLPDNCVDSVVCDPPYHLASIVERFGKTSMSDENRTGDRARAGADGMARLNKGFMGQTWDGGDIAFRPETWKAIMRVLKPGGHLVAFGASRNYHRMACAIEDAGFEIRDGLVWLYGTGFPKSHSVSKGIDKVKGTPGSFGDPKSATHAGWIDRGKMRGDQGGEGWQRPCMDDPEAVDRAARQYIPGSPEAEEWEGWGTALKPAHEPIVLARKPMEKKTVARNVLEWRVGAINIDACRVGYENDAANPASNPLYRVQNGYATKVGSDLGGANYSLKPNGGNVTAHAQGRWPANVVHDGSAEVIALFPNTGASSGRPRNNKVDNPLPDSDPNASMLGRKRATVTHGHEDNGGSAARYFYSAKANAADRAGSKHPTVKPLSLMQWLVRMVTPPGGTVLDPFAGTGTTGEAAYREGFSAILIEREETFQEDIRRRLRLAAVVREDRPHHDVSQESEEDQVSEAMG